MDLLSRLFIFFFPYEREQEVHPKHFRVSGIIISNVVTKEIPKCCCSVFQTMEDYMNLPIRFSC